MRSDIYWVGQVGAGRLAISPRPRGGDWLADEVRAWRTVGVVTVVSLLVPEEISELELDDEPEQCGICGIRFLTMPIPDRGLPSSRSDATALVSELLLDLRSGRDVLVHCRQGIGRASLVAASVLIASGEGPDEALRRIAAARGRPVPDTEEQAGWVRSYQTA